MPRLPRIHLDKALYFVTSQGGYGQKLFNDEADYKAYLELLGRYKEEHGFKLFAFVLMPNCLHLLIEPTAETTISTIMHSLNSNYTKYYNGRYSKSGHLFQGRFKAVIAQKEGYLLDLTRYIHLCSQRDKVCESAGLYAYSSYGRYSNRTDALGPQITAEIREVFSYIREDDAVTGYQKIMETTAAAAFENLRKAVAKPYLGSDEFIVEVKRRMEESSSAQKQNEVTYEEVIIRKPNPVFVAVGSVVIVILGLVAFNLYKINLGLQTTYETTIRSYTQQVASMQKTMAEAKMLREQLHEIERVAWEIQLTPVGETANGTHNDMLRFQKGKFISEYLSSSGYAPFEYQLVTKDDGTVIWQTSQTNPAGTKISWYGVWNGKMIRGLVSERPVEGTNRDFSFISTRQIQEKRGYENG